MKKSSFIALVALFVAATGVIIALAAYFKRKNDYLYGDDEFLFDDSDDLEYYTSELDSLDGDGEDEDETAVDEAGFSD